MLCQEEETVDLGVPLTHCFTLQDSRVTEGKLNGVTYNETIDISNEELMRVSRPVLCASKMKLTSWCCRLSRVI